MPIWVSAMFSKGEKLLAVDRIKVFYGDMQALWDTSFEVGQGQIVTVVGSNGAGKSTSLNAISGLNHPKNGTITFKDQRIEQSSPYRIVELGIAQIAEGRRLFPQMTVLENLEMGAFIKRARPHLGKSISWVLSLFPVLAERKSQAAGTMSGGEQQMLAIARALMSRPELLMLDEPSLGLAPRIVLLVFDTIKRVREEGHTILLVEQNVQHALAMADYGYTLETGRITMGGSGDKLLENEYVKKTYLGM
jgi:branched-chain amino acid transport system ATP-binding protein